MPVNIALIRHSALVALGVAALCSCAGLPPAEPAAPALADAPEVGAPFHTVDAKLFAQADLPDAWWQLYDDPQLDALVSEALLANADLRQADANLRRAAAVVQEARAGRNAQTEISAAATTSQLGGYTASLGQGTSYDLGFGVSYALDLAGGLRRGIEAAGADADAARAARDQVRVVLAAAVTRAYVATCAANRSLAATEAVLRVQRRTLEVTQTLAGGGRGTQFDVTRASAAVNESRAMLPPLIAQRQASLFELAILLGRMPGNYPKDLEHCQAPPRPRVALPVGDGWRLVRRRPDIRQAERTLAASRARIGVAAADLYPSISIGGSVGLAGPHAAPAFGGSLGPLLSWRFPNRAIARARIEQADAGAQAALAGFDATVLRALRQTESALSDYAQELQRENSLSMARDDAARANEQANTLFKFGRTSFIDVLTAESALANSESALASSRAQLDDRRIDLFLSLGGGWVDK